MADYPLPSRGVPEKEKKKSDSDDFHDRVLPEDREKRRGGRWRRGEVRDRKRLDVAKDRREEWSRPHAGWMREQVSTRPIGALGGNLKFSLGS